MAKIKEPRTLFGLQNQIKRWETPDNSSMRKSLNVLANQKAKEIERGILPSIQRGLQSGASGLSLGYQPQEQPQDESFLEHLGHLGGEVVSDIPAMIGGSIAGSAAGTAIAPGLGTAVGAGAGAFAAPAAIKQAFKEYRESGSDKTFGQYLESAGRIAKETGKSAIIGGATSQAAKLLPFAKEIPGVKKLLNYRAGRAGVEAGLELGTLTGTQAALEGELPSSQQLIDNAALIAGGKVAHGAAKPIGKVVKKAAPSFKPVVKAATNLVPESVRGKMKELGDKAFAKGKEAKEYVKSFKQTENQKKFFDLLKDHVGERDARVVESQFKWRESLETAQKEGKFTPENMEDMMYYRQKTGNPFKEGDTYHDVAKRLPRNAREFVDKVVDTHLKDSLKSWNENPLTRDINPREGMEDVYLPGLYEYDPPKYAKAYDEVSKRFKGKNPFSSEKTFMSYLDAFQKAGLKPRYKNIVDLMHAYDNTMARSLGNVELLDTIKKLDMERSPELKKTQPDLIVNSRNRKMYDKAKQLGYVPFDDPYLRRYVAGTKARGDLIHATTAAPALVHPDFAQAFQGVFKKDSFRPESNFWKAHDALRDTIRSTRVSLSPFHYGALMEHGVSALGPKAFAIKTWMQEGYKLRANKEFAKDAARSGLVLHGKEGYNDYKKGASLIDKALDASPVNVDLIKRANGHLFNNFHPNLKAVTWDKFVSSEVGKRIKEGTPPSEAEVKAIKRDMATLVNDIYGGQQWETQKYLNNPNNLKWFRRIIGYPDWTTSAIRNAANAFEPGLKGKQARKVWVQYLATFLSTQGMLKLLSGSVEQTDDKKSLKGIRLNFKKGYDELMKGDPSKWYLFPLPDFDVEIAGKLFNPGRIEEKTQKGEPRAYSKLYGHFGKQALEIGGWINHPFNELFGKSNPLIQMAFKQITGQSPYADGWWTVRGKWDDREKKPWMATKPGTAARGVERVKELAEDIQPFGVKTLAQKGIAPFIGSGLGIVPVSKGLNLYTARPYIEKALKKNDAKGLDRVIDTLGKQGYDPKEIKKVISEVNNKLKKK